MTSKLHVNLSFYVIGGRWRSDVVTTGRMVHPWSLGVRASESWSPAVVMKQELAPIGGPICSVLRYIIRHASTL